MANTFRHTNNPYLYLCPYCLKYSLYCSNDYYLDYIAMCSLCERVITGSLEIQRLRRTKTAIIFRDSRFISFMNNEIISILRKRLSCIIFAVIIK